MPGKLDIMHAIREGLDTIDFSYGEPRNSRTEWTRLILAKLCDIGQKQFGCYVCTNRHHAPKAESPAWLYNMTWLEYTAHEVGKVEPTGWLIDTPLVVKHNWGGVAGVEADFSRLMLARAGVRLMLCYHLKDGWGRKGINNADDMARHLGEWVRRFNGTCAEDAYLLAVLGWDESLRAHRFRYFILGLNSDWSFPGRDA